MRTQPKMCYPIVAPNLAAVRREIEREEHRYEAFEVWIEYLDHFAFEELQELLTHYGERLLILLRRKNLEPVQLPPAERRKVIELVGRSQAYLDLDVHTQQEDLGVLESLASRPKLIASAHHYEETPTDEQLLETIALMDSYAPAIYKLSAFCQIPDDALRLLKLGLQLLSAGKPSIVLGMGRHGAVTRIFGTLWSNELVFAPPRLEASSAPGQLSRDGLGTIFRILKEECGG